MMTGKYLSRQVFAANTNPNFVYFGYYFPDGTPGSTKQDYLPEIITTVGQVNIVVLEVDIDGKFPMENFLKSAQQRNVKVLLALHFVPYDGRANASKPSGTETYLRSNWQERMTILEQKLTPYLDTVYGFYLDEPYWNGLSQNDMNTVLTRLAQDYPTKHRMIIEAFAPLEQNQLPQGWFDQATDIGFDFYPSTIAAGDSTQLWNRYVQIYQKLLTFRSGEQRVWLVPDAFGPREATAQTGERLSQFFDKYQTLAQTDQRIWGMLNFVYSSTPSDASIQNGTRAFFGLDSNVPLNTPALLQKHKTLSGQVMIAHQALLPCSPADINVDEIVDLRDYAVLINKLFQHQDLGRADLNKDGVVNVLDYALFTPQLRQAEKCW